MSKLTTYTLRTSTQEYTLNVASKGSLAQACFYCKGQDKATMAHYTFKCVARVADRAANTQNKEKLAKEGELIKGLDHSTVVKCLEFGQGVIDSHGELIFVNFLRLEALPTRSLMNIVEEYSSKSGSVLDLKSKKMVFKQLAEGISYLHSKNIIHHNLKLSNIMVSNDLTSVKLFDFTFANPVEVETRARAEKSEDIFALGHILFGIHTGRAPFDSSEGSEWRKLFYSPFRLYYWQGVAKQNENITIPFIDIINGMLEADANKRIKIEGVTKHEFFAI